MLFGKPYKFLSEAATADLMDPATSDEVKDTVDDLQDTLTNNVEEVKPDDMVTNGGVPVTTAENALLVESNGRYYVSMEAVLAICEDEAEVPETASDDDAADACAEKAPDVVVLDLMLPGLSGEALLQKLAGSSVIVVSAGSRR